MAKTTIVQITDDLDGSKDAQSVTFSFQGADYSIDLNKKNLAALDKALKPYIAAASRVPASARRTGTGSSRRRPKDSGRTDLAAVRQWAKSEGIAVSDRGRIPQSVLDQYAASHQS